MKASKNELPKVRTLSRPQGLELLDRRARAELNMSGAEFIRRWRAGRFGKSADTPQVMRVAMLLPFVR